MTELYRSRLVTSTRQALCALTLVSGLMAAPSEAQVLYGSITGAVRDPSEAAIQGAGDARYSGYPHFATGLSALGNSTGSQPAFSDEGTFSLATNVTKVMGRHDLRAGYLGNFLYLSFWQPEQSNPRGVFTFAGNATALRGTGAQTANFYNTYAAFLMGLVGTAAKSVQYEEMTTREWQHGLFIRDRFQVSPKLTLDLGLRWEYYPIMHRADRGLERVDLATLSVLLGGRGDNPQNVSLEAAKDNFAPRLGLIYQRQHGRPRRLRRHVQLGPWGRPLRGFYPATSAASFFQNEPFGWFSTIDKASRPSQVRTCRAASSRCHRRSPCGRPNRATSTAARSSPITWRSSAACPWTSPWTLPTSAPGAMAGSPTSTSTRRPPSVAATTADRWHR